MALVIFFVPTPPVTSFANDVTVLPLGQGERTFYYYSFSTLCFLLCPKGEAKRIGE